MRKGKVNSAVKIEYVEKYLRGEISITGICSKLSAGKSTVKRWVRNYKTFGASDIEQGLFNTRYSKEFKLSAVQDFLAGNGSLNDVCHKYKIRSDKQLCDWIKLYNGHKELRSTGGKGSEIYMTKGRSTTLDERIEIVSHCIAHNKDYPATIEKYDVSYQQIHSWVSKYEKNGVDGLVDRRGKSKTKEEMTEVERLRAEKKLMQAEIEQKTMEIDLLKKLEELERRRR